MVPHRPGPGNLSLPHFVPVVGPHGDASASPRLAAPLRELLAHDFTAWTTRGLRSIKQRTVRTVLVGALGDESVHVKVFRADTFADRARDLLRGAPGLREAGNLQHARELGLPAVEPLAHGFVQTDEQRRSFVVTRSVDGAPFDFASASATVLANAGALLRSVHDKGLAPGDLHPGNLLVDAAGQLHLLDFTSLRHVGELDLVARARALAFFCQELDGGALDRQARPLLAAYLAAGPALPPALRRELTLATHRWRAGALPAFGRRAQRECKHTTVGEIRRGIPRWVWHLGAEPVAAHRPAVDAFFAAPPPPHKEGRRGAVWLLDRLVVKQRDAGAAQKLWRASYWLLFAKVAAPAPVAMRWHVGTGHVVTARLGTRSLAEELADNCLDADAIAAATRSIGTQVGRLHAHGLGNRDLKFDNLVRRGGDGEVCMVDLDGVRRRAATETRGRGHDLGRLLASFRAAGTPGGATTVRTFLRSYLRAHRRLLQQPPLRRLLRSAEQRAGEWASEHR